SVALDPATHLPHGRCAVLRSEGFPRKCVREDCPTNEEPSTDDEVFGSVKLEEQHLSGLQNAKATATARLPEVDLVDVRETAQETEPLVIGDGDEGLHPRSWRKRISLVPHGRGRAP